MSRRASRVTARAARAVLLVSIIIASALVVSACSCGGDEATAVADLGTCTLSLQTAQSEADTTETTVAQESTTVAAETATTWSPPPSTTTTSGGTLPSIQTGVSMQVMPLQQWNHIEEGNGSLHYSGTWMGKIDTEASGSVCKVASSSGAAAEVTFSGTKIRLVSLTGPQMGRAKLILDGGSPVYVELYDAAGASEAVWTSGTLADETHTLRIEWTGLKNPSATGSLITIDAIEVLGIYLI